MSLRYKFDILEALKKAGFSTYRLRINKILSESTIQKLRANNNAPLSWDNINTLCRLLHCQPGDIMEYVEDPKTEE